MFCCTKLTNSNPEDELATPGVGVTEWRKYSKVVGGGGGSLMASLSTSHSVQPPSVFTVPPALIQRVLISIPCSTVS